MIFFFFFGFWNIRNMKCFGVQPKVVKKLMACHCWHILTIGTVWSTCSPNSSCLLPPCNLTADRACPCNNPATTADPGLILSTMRLRQSRLDVPSPPLALPGCEWFCPSYPADKMKIHFSLSWKRRNVTENYLGYLQSRFIEILEKDLSKMRHMWRAKCHRSKCTSVIVKHDTEMAV